MQVKLCYFNEHWYVYLSTKGDWKSWSQEMETKIVKDETGEYRLRKYNCSEIPIYSFGYMYNEENKKRRPGHGGEWSSNSRRINEVFGTNLIEVGVDHIAVATPLDWLKELLGDRVEWEESPLGYAQVVAIKGVKNEYSKWVELTVFAVTPIPSEDKVIYST